jgi:hypothetical protein
VEVSPTKLALKIFFLLVCALALFVLATAPRGVLAQSAAQKSVGMPIGKPIQIRAPLGLPPAAVLRDPRLSLDGTIPCAGEGNHLWKGVFCLNHRMPSSMEQSA